MSYFFGSRAAPVRVMCCAVAAAAAASSLHAQTIVPNAYLHTELAPWEAFVSAAPDPVGAGAPPFWQSPPDVDANPASGSAAIDLTPSAVHAASGIGQCVDFATPTSVEFLNYGTALWVPDAAMLDGSVRAVIEIRLYASAGCADFLSGGSQGQVLDAASMSPSTWYRLADNSFVPNDAPVMAASAQVRGYLQQSGAATTQPNYRANFDHFVLVLNSTTPVELIRFQVD